MGKASIAGSANDLIESTLQKESLDLVDIEYKKKGLSWVLRIFIDKKGGVTVEDCRRVSRKIEDMLEVEELVPAPYTLEVSSPGLDRPLKGEKDFLRNIDKKVEITAETPIKGKNQFSGRIVDFKNNTLSLDIKGTREEIPLDAIAKAQLLIEF